MKKEIQIPVALGFCKKCFRSRREGSAYCGECQNEPERMKIYQDDKVNFPLVSDVISKMGLKIKDLNSVVFTYGDTIYADEQISYGLLAHELTHIFQQTKLNKDIWWGKYFKNKKFRLDQELEAYRQQYKVLKMNDPYNAEITLRRIAGDLSGVLYGYLVDFDKALALIIK